jgi:hypothetical protein
MSAFSLSVFFLSLSFYFSDPFSRLEHTLLLAAFYRLLRAALHELKLLARIDFPHARAARITIF